MTRPLVTIAIPTYNNAEYLRTAIGAALRQTYENIEVIVVDDRSTDGSLEIARSYSDSRLRIVENERNLGLVGNHNKVLEEARGTYLKVLHADDVIVPEAVAEQVAALEEQPTAVLATSKRAIIDDRGKRLLGRGAPWPKGVRRGAEVLAEIARSGRNLLGEPSAALFRVDAARRAGGYNAEWTYCFDVEFASRMLLQGDLYFDNRELASFRVTPGQQSAQLAESQKDEHLRFLRHLQSDFGLGITEAELAAASRTVSRDVMLRRLLYGVLSMPATYRERIAYLIVGGWNTLFSYIVFATLWAFFGKTWPYWVVLAIATAAGTVNGFICQRTFVFRSTGKILSEFGRFSMVYAVIGALNILVFPALVNRLSINPYVSQALFTAFVVVVGYIANKYFSFREPISADHAEGDAGAAGE